MFPRKLASATTHQSLKSMGDFKVEFEISDTGYGKDHVKMLHVRREGNVHYIKEFEVNTHLKLYSKKDYLNGNYFDTSNNYKRDNLRLILIVKRSLCRQTVVVFEITIKVII